ncbi:holo-ACP synthase [Thiomicrorhabdus sp. zzn3]|uniref:holo-ACP synthase n=1 Tax=Thiomicrorhabdus sp. zzn3 TaxID=3039775 RepID=UPI0024367D6E|nr:holo-ACP synthase [Thiomicrorhabdus sp. zzn3]MDG6777803.1 holo-ACP synthase [Thiomicrorhabdus sp. zzn3]
MIIGIGTDIVDVARIAEVYRRQGEAFARRILADAEWARFCEHRFPERYLAKRWAIKEAVSKALGTGIAQGVSFHDMVIENRSSGQPVLRLSGGARQKSDELGVDNWQISVSDEKTHAVAFVVAEKCD